VKNSYVPGLRSDISARCGPFNANYFFSRYIAGFLVGLDRLVVEFGVDPEVLKIEM
jgi:hypothetical protein